MKKLIVVVPARLNEDGTLFIKKIRSLQLMISFLKENYEITLLVQSYREKTISALLDLAITVIYDNSTSEYQVDISHCTSRFQNSYLRWAGRKVAKDNNIFHVFRLKYDCLIAWDGCSPWCLATALRHLNANQRIVWIHDDPNLYLLREDHSFYTKLCVGFKSLLASDEKIKSELDGLYEDASLEQHRSGVIKLPVDVSWYWKQSKQSCAFNFREDSINLLAVSRMSMESTLERLPRWLSEHQDYRPPIHCYLIGDGERLDRYIQQIAVYSVDNMVTLLGQAENPYPYICGCDILLVSEGERQPEMETAAQVFGVPLILFEKLENGRPELKKRKTSIEIEMPVAAWEDKDKLINIFEER